jgi:NADPH:quinone reductase
LTGSAVPRSAWPSSTSPRGVVVNIATQADAETVTFHAARFDRARGATIYTLNLPGQIELEASWREPSRALSALLQRRIGGKAVLHAD